MHGFLNDVIVGLLGLTTIANPVTSATVLLALTGHYPDAERNRQIGRATIYVTIVLIVAYIGFGMLFPPARAAEDRVQAEMAAHTPPAQLHDIAFVPLTMPCTTGPGTIAFIISAASTIHMRSYTYSVHLAVVTVAILFALEFWICMSGATTIKRLLGVKGIDALARVMGFLLVCIGVQFAINGIQDLLQAWGFIAA
jgi:multiple antibiotic resistance protein